MLGVFGVMLLLGAVQPAGAVTLPCGGGYAFASQYTAPVGGYDTPCPGSGYFGYAGVDGQIQTPPALPSGLGSDDHSLGYLNASFGSAWDSWLQIGWMAGYLGEPGLSIQSFTQYKLYFEQVFPSGAYYVTALSSLSLSTNITYRIDYVGNGCWNTYYNYNVLADQSCTYPSSGVMVASNETGNGGTGSYSSMPISWFGSSTSNTNQTLRLKGGGGWGDWTSAVRTSYTQYRPYFFNSPAVANTYFETYGSTQ